MNLTLIRFLINCGGCDKVAEKRRIIRLIFARIKETFYELSEEERNLMERFGFKATIPQSKTGFGAYRLRIYRRDHLVSLIPSLLRFMKHREKVDRLAKLYEVLVGR